MLRKPDRRRHGCGGVSPEPSEERGEEGERGFLFVLLVVGDHVRLRLGPGRRLTLGALLLGLGRPGDDVLLEVDVGGVRRYGDVVVVHVVTAGRRVLEWK